MIEEVLTSHMSKLTIYDVYDEMVKKYPDRYYQIVQSPVLAFEDNIYEMKSMKFSIEYSGISIRDFENIMYTGLDKVVEYLSKFDYGVLLYQFNTPDVSNICSDDCKSQQVQFILRFCELKEPVKTEYFLEPYNKEIIKVPINETVLPLSKNKHLVLDDEVEIVDYNPNDKFFTDLVAKYNIVLESYDLDTLEALPGEIDYLIQELKSNNQDGKIQVCMIALNPCINPYTFENTVRFILYYNIVGE